MKNFNCVYYNVIMKENLPSIHFVIHFIGELKNNEFSNRMFMYDTSNFRIYTLRKNVSNTVSAARKSK